METNLTPICKEQHSRMVDKGFYDKPKELGTQLMLIVGELGEALEADRKGRHADLEAFEHYFNDPETNDETKCNIFRILIKDTFEDEIADTFIRLFDFVGSLGIDIDKYIKMKMWYNSTRPKRHGKLY